MRSTTKANTAAALTMALGLVLTAPPARAAPVLAATPPMGWNSWNHFAGKIDDATVRAQADAMVKSGMRDAGYVYVNIDDTWQGTRDAAGVIHANARFPDMKALAAYVHSLGLKLGIYSSPGPKTCAGFEGSYGHEVQDAKTYATWGIDYLKYDLCSLSAPMIAAGSLEKAQTIELAAYRKMGDALRATGRPIVYSLCQYGFSQVWRWGGDVGGNLWRTTGDIEDKYPRMATIGFGQAGLSKFAKSGQWNDPDMLEVGNGGMTPTEYRTHMSLWALLAAPLLAGNDLSTMTQQTVSILTNRDVIAIDQDLLGAQGDRVSQEGPLEIWAKPLAGGAKAVGLFNTSDLPAVMTVDLTQLGFFTVANPGILGGVQARDVWSGKPVQLVGGRYTVEVPAHGVALLRVTQS